MANKYLNCSCSKVSIRTILFQVKLSIVQVVGIRMEPKTLVNKPQSFNPQMARLGVSVLILQPSTSGPISFPLSHA